MIEMNNHIYDKKALTTIVTDSGLGGISVAAELYYHLKERAQYEKARIIFFNSLFHEESGYTFLERSQQIKMFDAALHGMLNYSPDLILIACNTLSIVYPHTPFAKSVSVPVIGIVEIGVKYILRKIRAEENAVVFIFGMPVTIKAGTYKRILMQYLPETPVIGQSCPELAFAIGDGETERIKQLITKNVTQALQKLEKTPGKIYASLNCTHFGYYQNEFLQAFLQKGIDSVEILNPNSEMVNLLFVEKGTHTVSQPVVTIEFVSKTKINENGMKSLIPLLEPLSKEVALAFQNYHYNPELF